MSKIFIKSYDLYKKQYEKMVHGSGDFNESPVSDNINNYIQHLDTFDYLYDYDKGALQQVISPEYILSMSNESLLNQNIFAENNVNYTAEKDPGEFYIDVYGFYIHYEELFINAVTNIGYNLLCETGMLEVYTQSDLPSTNWSGGEGMGLAFNLYLSPRLYRLNSDYEEEGGFDKSKRYIQITDDAELHSAFDGVDRYVSELAELKKR